MSPPPASTRGVLSHDDLCRLAVSWLKRSSSRSGPGCQVAFTEAGNGWLTGEIPDAIGFRAGIHGEASVVVEVKVSRADFHADKTKPHRLDPSLGVGRYRYYLAPAGLLRSDEIPDSWGLIEASSRGGLKVLRGHVLTRQDEPDGWSFEARNFQREIGILARMLCRVGDVDELHRKVKEARRLASRATTEMAALRARDKELTDENRSLVRLLRKLRRAEIAMPDEAAQIIDAL